MMFLQKRKPGSMFKRFFVFTTFTVLFCLIVASFSLMFFFVNFWKNARFTSLSDDALSLARSVETLYDNSGIGFLRSTEQNDSMLIVAGALVSVADSSGVDMLLLDADGNVLLCKDNVNISSESIIIEKKCVLHSGMRLNRDILDAALANVPRSYNYEGSVAESDPENYFITVVPMLYEGTAVGYAAAMQTVTDAYLPYTTEFIRMVIATALIAVLFTFIASLIVSYRMVRPLKKMTATTKKYAVGNFEERIRSVETYNELQEFVDAFNSMADSLAVTEESRSSFVANVSHELKTPMTIINGFVDGILDGTIGENDREKYLQIVSEETKRLSRLVIAMLNMSKIEAGKLTLAPVDIHLHTMLCNTLIGFEKNINEKNINISGLDELEELTVNADDALINQVLYNLIDNAVKFTPENGTISFALFAEKKNAVITIRNSGKGIPKEECELVFDRFYKVDKSRGMDVKSFGLGLHIVKSIIELHNGTITINSVENEYTEFVLKLPLNGIL